MPPRPSIATLSEKAPPGVATVLDYLAHRFPHVGRETWVERFARGMVLSNDGPLTADSPFRPQLRVRYFREVEREFPVRTDWRIEYEDGDLLVVDKPPFLPVTPAGGYVRHCLLNLLEEALAIEGLAPLHRLDKDTSGLVLFSRNPATRGHFSRLFSQGASRHLVKEYWAVCEATRGDFPERMRLEDHVARSPQAYLRQAVFEDRPANSACEVERIRWLGEPRGQGGDLVRLVLLRVLPLTGRQHQIRVQLSHAGLPILNDRIYGRRPRHDPEDLSDPMQLECRRLAIVDYPAPDGSERINRDWRVSRTYLTLPEGDP